MRKNILFTVMAIVAIVSSVLISGSINAKTICTTSPDAEKNRGFCVYSFPENGDASCVTKESAAPRCSGATTVIDSFTGVNTDIHSKP